MERAGAGAPTESQGWLQQGTAVRRVLSWLCLQGTIGDMPQLWGKWPTWVFLYGHRIARNSHLHRDGEFIFARSCMSRQRRKRHFLIIINQLYLKRKRNQLGKWDAKEMRGKTISLHMDTPSKPWQHFLVSTCIKVTSPLQVARNTKSEDTGEAQEHPVRGKARVVLPQRICSSTIPALVLYSCREVTCCHCGWPMISQVLGIL